LLLLGPSLGTSVTALWSVCAARLGTRFHVVGWDLPGHGTNHAVADGFSIAELAGGVLALADDVLADREEAAAAFYYAGDSVGGAVGLQLLLDASDRISSAALLCTGARIGDVAMWTERAATVRASGTPVMIASSAERWFGPGFLTREPAAGATLLSTLQDADAEGYAQICDALATFDVRDRLAEIGTAVLAIAGTHDESTPPAKLLEIARGVRHGSLTVLDGVAHLAPIEQPDQVAELLLAHFGRPSTSSGIGSPLRTPPDPARPLPEPGPTLPEPGPTLPEPVVGGNAAGMKVRREVLGDAHVDRATAAATDFTREFQEFITSYAWGGIWTRPGLDRRSRSMITLTALVARGHHEELAMHVRAARTNGLTNDEIKEVLLQTAIYCGVPDANTAFRIAQQVLADLDQTTNEETP
jgi:3-oxoadipate enol-lactonase/4-carboxymuconolactone decarboxylase